jgi:hypothetical protein
MRWGSIGNGQTYIVKEEKTASGSKNRLTLLLGGNSNGDLKLKPLLVYNSENPRTLKGYTETELPVIWKSNKKALIMMKIFEEWFKDHFAPPIKDCLKKNNLSDKALFILNNASGHPTILDNLVLNIHVVFLIPNMTALLQPTDQGVTTTNKHIIFVDACNN